MAAMHARASVFAPSELRPRRRGRRRRATGTSAAGSRPRSLRAPLLAALGSLVFPGLGQALGGSFLRGAVWLLAWWLAVGMAGDDQLSGVMIAVRVAAAADAFAFVRVRLARRPRATHMLHRNA